MYLGNDMTGPDGAKSPTRTYPTLDDAEWVFDTLNELIEQHSEFQRVRGAQLAELLSEGSGDPGRYLRQAALHEGARQALIEFRDAVAARKGWDVPS